MEAELLVGDGDDAAGRGGDGGDEDWSEPEPTKTRLAAAEASNRLKLGGAGGVLEPEKKRLRGA